MHKHDRIIAAITTMSAQFLIIINFCNSTMSPTYLSNCKQTGESLLFFVLSIAHDKPHCHYYYYYHHHYHSEHICRLFSCLPLSMFVSVCQSARKLKNLLVRHLWKWY